MSDSKTDDNSELKGVAKLLRKQNLSIFEKDMEGDAMKRYMEVRQKVERILVEQMRSTHQTDSDPQMAIQLLSLGENNSNAAPCLVVFCAPKKCKRIRRLLNSGRVMKLCKPERGLPGLEVRVIRCSSQMWLLYQDEYFGFRNSKSATATATTNDQTTSPGAPISLTSASEESSRPWKRKEFGKGKVTIDRSGLRREQNYLGPYSKQWEPLFSTDRRFRDGEAYIPQKRLMGADGDDFTIFFTDFEESVPSFEVEGVLEFCKWTSLRDLQSVVGMSEKRGAWLDDRSCPTREDKQRVRTYMNPLTARELYQLLNATRFDDPNEPDVDRRLIYVSDLNPCYILALTETATFHEVPVLKDAICKHFTLQTSIRVRITQRGYKLFHLEFNIPYFALRPSPPSEDSLQVASKTRPPRRWIDLSFLKLRSPKAESECNYGIHQAHISLALSGSDHEHWTAFAFVDTAFDDEELEESMFSGESFGFNQDPIASDPWIQANLPIWDPREYFLVIFELRIVRVCKEWRYLVQSVEQGVREYREKHSLTLSQDSGPVSTREEDVKDTEKWTRQIVELLNQLQDVLSETVKAWEIFNSKNGDIDYFSDIDFSQNRCHGSLSKIKETFEVLESHQRTLQKLSKSCHDSAQNLQIRLSRRGTEATISSTAISDFTLFFLGPPALAAACFQLPQAVLPFPHNPFSFVLLTIVIMLAMKLLHVISCLLPGSSWWWNKTAALTKAMKLEGCGSALPSRGLSVSVQPGDHDRNTFGRPDVEMGIRSQADA